MAQIRIDKYLADMGIGTRSEVKKILKSGQVTLNGEKIKKPEQKINSETDEVLVNQKPVVYQEFEYYMLNKAGGVVSATKDKKEKTVLDCIDSKKRKDLFPVGRLDKDTEGLLLITNDGELAHRLLSPKKHVDKTYFVKLREPLKQEYEAALENGIDIAVYGGDFDNFYWDVKEKTNSLLMFDIVQADSSISNELKKEIQKDGVVIYEKA